MCFITEINPLLFCCVIFKQEVGIGWRPKMAHSKGGGTKATIPRETGQRKKTFKEKKTTSNGTHRPTQRQTGKQTSQLSDWIGPVDGFIKNLRKSWKKDAPEWLSMVMPICQCQGQHVDITLLMSLCWYITLFMSLFWYYSLVVFCLSHSVDVTLFQI